MVARIPLNHYLLVFDHVAGALTDCQEFSDVDEALTAYESAERSYEQADRVEVVLIGSDSLETVRETHANYFDGTAALARALVDLRRSATRSAEIA